MNVDKDYLGKERGSAEGEGEQERVGRELELVRSHLQSRAERKKAILSVLLLT